MCVHTKSLSCIWLFVTLWTVALQAPLSMGFSGKNTGVSCHALLPVSSRPRDQTHLSMSPALADNFLTTSTTWEALEYTKPDQTQTNQKLERGLRRKHLPQIIFSLLSRMSRYEFVKAERGRSCKEEEGKVCKSPLERRRWCDGRA